MQEIDRYKKALSMLSFGQLYHLEKKMEEEQAQRNEKLLSGDLDSFFVPMLENSIDVWEERLAFVNAEITHRMERLFELGDHHI